MATSRAWNNSYTSTNLIARPTGLINPYKADCNTGCDNDYNNGCNTGCGTEDFSGTCQRFEDTDIYEKAINVSEPRVLPDNCAPPVPCYRQKVVRRVEVPFTRKVKVPTETTKIVPTMVDKEVRTKKLVQVPTFKMVDEEYTEFEEREEMRKKEIWVKQIVEEPVTVKVPVKKIRQVQRPDTEIKEIEEIAIVQVPSSKVIKVPGFRIDEVQDSKIVEVEELEEVEYKPHPTGRTTVHTTRDLGRVQGDHLSRTKGSEIYDSCSNVVCGIDTDSNHDEGRYQSVAYGGGGAQSARSNSYYRQSGIDQGGYNGQQSSRGGYGDAQVAYSTSTYTDSKFVRPAGDFQKRPEADQRNQAMLEMTAGGSLGVSLKNTHTRHTDGTGVLVTKVERGGAAARGGLQANDLITSVAGQPTATVEDFRDAVSRAGNVVSISVNRDGRRNVNVTIYR